MDDVRLTEAERQALAAIEAQLSKDRDLNRMMRSMKPVKRGLFHRTPQSPVTVEADPVKADPAETGPVQRPAPEKDPDSGLGLRGSLSLALLCIVVFTALVTTASVYLMVAGFVLAVIGCTVGAVWLCVTLMLRRAGPGH